MEITKLTTIKVNPWEFIDALFSNYEKSLIDPILTIDQKNKGKGRIYNGRIYYDELGYGPQDAIKTQVIRELTDKEKKMVKSFENILNLAGELES